MSRGLLNRTARTQRSESHGVPGNGRFRQQGLRLLAMPQELKRVLLEALVVSTAGLVFALVANFASPRGLSLTRNYFPGPNTSGVGPGAESTST